MAGVINLVSVGPGFIEHITPAAEQALKSSEIIVSYELYLVWIGDCLNSKEVVTLPLTQERERAQLAITHARNGKKVALVSSGDIGIYGMATLVFESMSEDDDFDVRVIPGITAASSCASLLGAPLSHDFATLSLSDLLCPWEWIENRARSFAKADVAVVLYNVQSKQRQEGIYKILQIMLEHKNDSTLCGIVRSAYRNEQKISITTLDQLPHEQFDMHTSIIIGNRFTKRKRNWIYTPRGYNSWSEPIKKSNTFPEEAIWVFSGTSDGNQLANMLTKSGYKVVVSSATEYGGSIAGKVCSNAYIISARHGTNQRKSDLKESNAKMILDATHPYATNISRQLIEIAQDLDIQYLRFERPSLLDTSNGSIICKSAEEASKKAISLGKRIFLATGSNNIDEYLQVEKARDCLWFVRTTTDPEFIQKVIKAGIPHEHICAMQGPFSQAFNETLWREWQIDCVITKDSGKSGGFEAKVKAAQALKIPLIVLQRPQMEYPQITETIEDTLQWVIETYN